jgi:hypothetical protein
VHISIGYPPIIAIVTLEVFAGTSCFLYFGEEASWFAVVCFAYGRER